MICSRRLCKRPEGKKQMTLVERIRERYKAWPSLMHASAGEHAKLMFEAVEEIERLEKQLAGECRTVSWMDSYRKADQAEIKRLTEALEEIASHLADRVGSQSEFVMEAIDIATDTLMGKPWKDDA